MDFLKGERCKMGRTPNLLDLQYVNREGDTMTGPLILPGDPVLDAHAASKRYVDLLNANMGINALMRSGALPMTGPLILAGPPTAADHAATRDYVIAQAAAAIVGLATVVYVDAGDAAERVYADAQDALRLLLAGGNMTGDIVLAGPPTLGNHPATMTYTDTADALRLRLAGGVMTGFITLHADPANAMHPATKQYVDALPVSPPTYDARVAAAGGDYTSVVTACATEAAGARIFVERGTYNETANIVMKDGQMLIGQNPEDTVIDFGAANRKITPAGAGTNRMVKDLTIQGSIADYTVEMNGTYDRVENCRIIGTINANTGLGMSGTSSVAENNYITGFTKVAPPGLAMEFTGNYGLAVGNTIETCRRGLMMGTLGMATGNTILAITNIQLYVGNLCSVVCNKLYGNISIVINSSDCKVVGNLIRGGVNCGNAYDHVVIAENEFYLSAIQVTNANAHTWTISGNVFNAGAGIEYAGYRATITGNVFSGTAHLQFSANSKWNIASGNNLDGSSEANLTRIEDLGLRGNQAYNNRGVPTVSEKKFADMKNTSGGALADGDVVVLKAAVANGNEITTTVNQGDDLVFGMVNEAINNNAEGGVQTEGKVVTLKVNGVINIGIGDLLGTFTAAGIAMQAQAGDMAFAVALEAYAGADSLGVIDALLITPRKV